MKSKAQIDHFKGFCKIVKETFPIRFLEEISLKKEDLIKNQQTLLQGIKLNANVIRLIGNKQYDFTIVSKLNREVALNIVNWLLEK